MKQNPRNQGITRSVQSVDSDNSGMSLCAGLSGTEAVELSGVSQMSGRAVTAV